MKNRSIQIAFGKALFVVATLLSLPAIAQVPGPRICTDALAGQQTSRYRKPKNEAIFELQSPQGMDFVEFTVSSSQRSSRDLVDKPDGTHLVTIQGATDRSVRITTIEYEQFFVEVVRPITHTSKLPSYDKLLTPEEVKEFSYLRPLPHLNPNQLGWRDPNFHHNYADLDGFQRLSQKIIEQLDFVLTRYQAEKPWGADFLQRLVKVAFQYAQESTYISVRERTLEGPGKILGSVRLISTPFVNLNAVPDYDGVADPRSLSRAMELLRNELSLYSNGLEFDFNSVTFKNSEMWKQIFGADKTKFSAADLTTPPVRTDGSLAFIPAPYESILNRQYIRERKDVSADLQYFVEPGNFAVTPDRELPTHLRGLAAPALYFHLSRLIRKESGAPGATTHVGTYASEGSTSDRFYRSLGFQIKESIHQDAQYSPTAETWNVLMGDQSVLETALLTRFGPDLTSQQVSRIYGIFDQFDRRPMPKEKVEKGRFVHLDGHEATHGGLTKLRP